MSLGKWRTVWSVCEPWIKELENSPKNRTTYAPQYAVCTAMQIATMQIATKTKQNSILINKD